MTCFWLVQMTYTTFELRIATLALAKFKLTRLFMQAIHPGKFSMPMTNYVNMVLGYIVCICSFSLILCWGLQRRVPLESIAIVNVLVSPGNQITGAIWNVCNAVMQPMESQFYFANTALLIQVCDSLTAPRIYSLSPVWISFSWC